MKGIVVTTDNEMEVKDFGGPLYETVGALVGGCIEIVHPTGLDRPYVMIVNDEGLILGLPLNITGSVLYGTPQHGQPIVGNIVIMKQGMTSSGPDIIGLDEVDINTVKDCLRKAFRGLNDRKENQ